MTILVQYAAPKDEDDAQKLASAIRSTQEEPVDILETSAEPSEPGGVLFRDHDAVFVVGGQRANPTYAFLENAGIVESVTFGRPEVIGNGIVRDPETGTETPVFGLAGNTSQDTDKLVSAMTGGGTTIATQALDLNGIRGIGPVDPFDVIDDRLEDIFRRVSNVLPGGIQLVGIKTEPDQDKLRLFLRQGGFSIDQARQQIAISATVIAAAVLGVIGGVGVTYTTLDVLNLFGGSKETVRAPSTGEVERCREQNDTPEELQECLEDKIETEPGGGGGNGSPLGQIQELVVLGVGGAILLQVVQGGFN
jgi:hypothetical protein